MSKKTITLFSISTIVVVLVIASIVLLVGNYTKNFNSGINLDPKIIDTTTNITNHTLKDKVWVFAEPTDMENAIVSDKNLNDALAESYLVLGIIGTAQANSGYNISLNHVRLRGSRINISYRINTPQRDKTYADVIIYPQTFIKIAKDNLPIGVPLEFAFYNQTTKTEQIINKTLTL